MLFQIDLFNAYYRVDFISLPFGNPSFFVFQF